MTVHRLTARNTAAASPNKIHDEDVARSYGFAGGLVPGVTIFAWMCGPALEAFGEDWLRAGNIDARFERPVYDGDDVTIQGELGEDGNLSLTVRTGDERCAAGRAASGGGSRVIVPDRAALPGSPPAAGPESLRPGTILGTVEVPYERDRAGEYLSSIGADHGATLGIAHPGWLLLLANMALSANVALGPWIHVASVVRLHDAVADGEVVAAPARVAEAYERKGHRFVELDVALLASERHVASVRHTAIYQPRRS